MSGGNASWCGEGHLRIDDAWIVAHAADNSSIDCRYRDGKDPDHDTTATGRAGLAKGVMIKGDATTVGNAAWIRGFLWDESPIDADDYYINAGLVCPLRFKRIYAQGTTARGIKIIY